MNYFKIWYLKKLTEWVIKSKANTARLQKRYKTVSLSMTNDEIVQYGHDMGYMEK